LVLGPFPSAGADPQPGTIRGVVRFTGQLPPAQQIRTTDGSLIEHHDLVVDKKSKGLRYVLAVLEEAPAQAKVQNAKRVIVDQRDMLFLPRVVAVQHGQEIRFENNDLCNHSVMTETLTRSNQFNYFAGPGSPIDRVFEPQKGPVKIGCALHSWMRAWVHVVPHPWFALSDEQGQFQVDKVPPGKHTLLLTHVDTGLQERRTVNVEAGKTLELVIDWEKAKP
jgi:plastocyanin